MPDPGARSMDNDLPEEPPPVSAVRLADVEAIADVEWGKRRFTTDDIKVLCRELRAAEGAFAHATREDYCSADEYDEQRCADCYPTRTEVWCSWCALAAAAFSLSVAIDFSDPVGPETGGE